MEERFAPVVARWRSPSPLSLGWAYAVIVSHNNLLQRRFWKCWRRRFYKLHYVLPTASCGATEHEFKRLSVTTRCILVVMAGWLAHWVGG
jgi:hypothetical protein